MTVLYICTYPMVCSCGVYIRRKGVSVDAVECLARILRCIHLDKNLGLVKDLSDLSTLKTLTSDVINELILIGIFANSKHEASAA